jgi:hypothetical protein
MSILIELSPEEEAQLRARAQARGELPEALLGRMIRSILRPLAGQTPGPLQPVVDETGQFRQDRWEGVLASIQAGTSDSPSLPPEAVTREAIYGDHD